MSMPLPMVVHNYQNVPCYDHERHLFCSLCLEKNVDLDDCNKEQ